MHVTVKLKINLRLSQLLYFTCVNYAVFNKYQCHFKILLVIFFGLTSPKAPLPITFKDSKSSKPSLVLFRRRNSVSFCACADLLILF